VFLDCYYQPTLFIACMVTFVHLCFSCNTMHELLLHVAVDIHVGKKNYCCRRYDCLKISSVILVKKCSRWVYLFSSISVINKGFATGGFRHEIVTNRTFLITTLFSFYYSATLFRCGRHCLMYLPPPPPPPGVGPALDTTATKSMLHP
jgi:hypothetical protein